MDAGAPPDADFGDSLAGLSPSALRTGRTHRNAWPSHEEWQSGRKVEPMTEAKRERRAKVILAEGEFRGLRKFLGN